MTCRGRGESIVFGGWGGGGGMVLALIFRPLTTIYEELFIPHLWSLDIPLQTCSWKILKIDHAREEEENHSASTKNKRQDQDQPARCHEITAVKK